MNQFPDQIKQVISDIKIVRMLGGTDTIMIEFDTLASPFPELDKQEPRQYPSVLKQECRRGYAEKWLSKVGLGNRLVNLITDKGSEIIMI